ncbi:hypothetical protein V1478_007013 [Vespula squamosa]|uniref:Uncharacterized protein n=1 Tax=Vespula squamosa TaxID=30214 RepID=A0ABD2B1Z1_VESSQ
MTYIISKFRLSLSPLLNCEHIFKLEKYEINSYDLFFVRLNYFFVKLYFRCRLIEHYESIEQMIVYNFVQCWLLLHHVAVGYSVANGSRFTIALLSSLVTYICGRCASTWI